MAEASQRVNPIRRGGVAASPAAAGLGGPGLYLALPTYVIVVVLAVAPLALLGPQTSVTGLNNVVQGNLIGLSTAGTALGNGTGIFVDDSPGIVGCNERRAVEGRNVNRHSKASELDTL